MRPALAIALLLIFIPHATAQTTASQSAETTSSESGKEQWSLYLNVSGYLVPHDRSYASPVFSADRNHIHLAARYNYEDTETGSLWFGYNFNRGDNIVLEVTPMIGEFWGILQASLLDIRQHYHGSKSNFPPKANLYLT
jgi:hypothetical protein